MLRFLTSWIRNFAESLEMSCQDAERVHSRCCDGVAEPGQSLGLWIHHLYCRGCRVYARQVNLLRAAARKLRPGGAIDKSTESASMPRDVAERIAKRVGPVK